ncbi:hypothetical protein R3I94_001745 [Phoxinus phoxinus]
MEAKPGRPIRDESGEQARGEIENVDVALEREMIGSRELRADWKESERDGGGGKSLSALRGLERPCPGPAAQCWLTVNPPLVPPPLPHTSSDSFEAFEEPAACHTAAHTVLPPRILRHSKVGVNNQISLR